MRLVVSVDDLFEREQIERFLVPIQKELPHFRVTVSAIPNRLGPIMDWRGEYPWVTFGIHGWEHTRGECGVWSLDQAKDLIQKALSMGYDPLFKAPNWIVDLETEQACKDLGVTLFHHESYEVSTVGLKHFPGKARRALKNCQTLSAHFYKRGVDNFIGDHPGFDPSKMKFVTEFLTPLDLAVG